MHAASFTWLSKNLPASVAGLIAVGLCACTTAQPRTATTDAHRVGDVVQDAAYVDHVERVARRRGITLTWVNPPGRRVGAAQEN